MPIPRNKKMLAAQERKLLNLLPGMLAELGFTQTKPPGDSYPVHGEYVLACPWFDGAKPLDWAAEDWPQNRELIEHPEYRELQAQGTTLTVTPMLDNDGWPWLACKFRREPLAIGRELGDIRHNQYYDLHKYLGVAYYSGKWNCHIFERMTGEEALAEFRRHLTGALNPNTSVV